MPSKYKKRNTAYLTQPHSGKKAPEAEGDVALKVAMGTYGDDNAAREFLEKARWGKDGAFCPHCGSHDVTKLEGKATRPGVYKCKSKGCRKQFTVTVGTIFESSHIKLRVWVIAFHAMCSSKKGVSAHQLHRELNITYKSAWFMCHRIRHAMDYGIEKKLEGVVEADEAWMGGKPRNPQKREDRTKHTKKAPVVVLVERDGKAIARPVKNVSVKEITDYLLANINKLSALMTDESGIYTRVGWQFMGGHRTTNHQSRQYARRENGMNVHSNTAESFIAILKRGHYGVYHQMSEKHLAKYCNEFSFRWSNRKASDAERTLKAIQGAEGKRLTYK